MVKQKRSNGLQDTMMTNVFQRPFSKEYNLLIFFNVFVISSSVTIKDTNLRITAIALLCDS